MTPVLVFDVLWCDFFVDIISVLFDTCINLTHRHMYKSLLESFYHRDMFVARKNYYHLYDKFAGLPPKDRREPCYL